MANDVDDHEFGTFDAEDLALIESLLQQSENALLPAPLDDEARATASPDIEDYELSPGLRLPEHSTRLFGEILRDADRQCGPLATEPATDTDQRLAARRDDPPQPANDPGDVTPGQDNRSPIERFRRPPKKALSVTDIVSPAWCELQYFYTVSAQQHGQRHSPNDRSSADMAGREGLLQ